MTHVWKTRLLAGAAVLTVACALGVAASPAAAQAPAAPPANSDQLLQDHGFYLEADTVIHDDQAHTWTAMGSVEARYQGRVLRADTLTYNESTGISTARGDVQLINSDGSTEFARSMTMDKDFKTGIALGFSTRQPPNAKIVADEAVRLNQDTMELNKAVFTVCDICSADGRPEEPTWSIQAAQVVQDHKRQLVYYKHAIIRVRGLPVFYTPVFWHVDPTAKRGSGLLAPRIAEDGRRGFSYEQPYLWVLSPYADLTVAPQINTKVNPFLEGEYRERFYSGQIDARFGYTFDNQFDNHGKKYDDATSRSYILAQGAFAPTPNWTWGFSAERVTDPLLFQRYGVPNVFDPRGLFVTDDQRLISQVYAVEQSSRSYLSIAAMSFQGLRPGDQNGTFPIVAPLIEGRFEPNWTVLGGRVRLEGGGVLLQRSRAVATDTGPGDNNSRRASFGGDWRATYTLYDGIRLSPFLQGRGDLYNVGNPSYAVGANTVTQLGDFTTGRLLGTAGVDASWPFYRRTGDMTVVLEPLVQLAASPAARTNRYIPNEDSTTFELDETTLFEANKSPGFDYYEGGVRANVGGRASVRWDDGPSAEVLFGRSFRTRPDPTLPIGTSLGQTSSDWVVAASASANPGISAYARALLDGHDGAIHRLEAGLNGAAAGANGYLRFYKEDANVSGVASENFQGGGQILVTKHWGLTASANYDFIAKVPVQEEFGVVYQDGCTHLELVFQHDGTYNRALRPSDKVILRLLLVTLGSSGYQRPDFR